MDDTDDTDFRDGCIAGLFWAYLLEAVVIGLVWIFWRILT